MPASTAPSVTSARPQALLVLTGVVAAVYAFGHLSWFLGTPLGRVPVLDARENLALANEIVTGTLPIEPFYRAPGYALILATIRLLGVSAAGLFPVALALGAVLHAVNATLVAGIGRSWFGLRSGVAAGLLFGLNPVFVHFAVNVTDATPALTCFLAGLAIWAPESSASAPRRARRWMIASLWWAAATVIRPNYLLLWITLPLLALVEGCRQPASARVADRELERAAHQPARRGFLAALAGLAVFAAVAGWQFRLSGTPGFLPTQGPYNLWAANRPGSNGRYYTQKIALPAAVAAQNPARAESLLLFRAETGRTAPNLAIANAYWRQRFVTYVVHHPLEWAALLGRKFYALLNDWEQYNNETPAFQIARSPWLRWNPIGWGLLLVLCIAGGVRLQAEQPGAIGALALVGTACVGSALLFYVSARFRLPLAAFITVFAGGALGSWTFWGNLPRPKLVATGAACTVAAFVTFSSFDGVRDRATYVQDHALLARAAETVGDDRLTWTEAEAALALRPDHPDALRLAVASYFNLLLAGQAPATGEPRWRDAAKRLLATPMSDAGDLHAVAAFALWRRGDHAEATKIWRQLGPSPSAIAARLLTHDPSIDPGKLRGSVVTPEQAAEPLVRLTAVELDLTGIPRPSAADCEALRVAAERLLAPRSEKTAPAP